MIGRWCGFDPSHRRFYPFTFITHRGFDTRVLAYTLDSLVRVSRRVGGRHFVRHRKTLHLSRGRRAERGLNMQTPPEDGLQYLPAHAFRRSQLMLTLLRPEGRSATAGRRFPFGNFKSFALSFQSSFHLSLAVLVRYRSLADI